LPGNFLYLGGQFVKIALRCG